MFYWRSWQIGQHLRFCSSVASVTSKNSFKPSKILLLTKLTRYEYEKSLRPELTEEQLKKRLRKAGSDYDGLLARHNQHKERLDELIHALNNKAVDVRVVNRFDYTRENIDWADAIFTAGGDGTFLLAANAITCKEKPIIGYNSDPARSEGYLCMPKRCTYNISEAINSLFSGNFRWLWRQRIRVTVHPPPPNGSNNSDAPPPPAHYHRKALESTQYTSAYNNDQNNASGMLDLADINTAQSFTARFHEHIAENEALREEINDEHNPLRLPSATSDLLRMNTSQNDNAPLSMDRPIVLPLRALNEVFVGEALSARVSYYEMAVDDCGPQKQKSSGVTLCTGTGSSSWHMHINQLSTDSVQQLLRIIQFHCNSDPSKQICNLPLHSTDILQRITEQYNSNLYFDPEDPVIGYSVRDPVRNGVFQVSRPKGFAKEVFIRSRMWDGHLVIDGGSCYPFNEGSVAHFSIFPEDALCCIAMN